MNVQALDNLLWEVEMVLSAGSLQPPRLYYFEGARDYLVTLKRLMQDSGNASKPSKRHQAVQSAEEQGV